MMSKRVSKHTHLGIVKCKSRRNRLFCKPLVMENIGLSVQQVCQKNSNTHAALSSNLDFYKVCLFYPNEDITQFCDVVVRTVSMNKASKTPKYKIQPMWTFYYDSVINGTVIGFRIHQLDYISFDSKIEATSLGFHERVEVLLHYKRLKPSRIQALSIPMWAIVSNKVDWYNYILFEDRKTVSDEDNQHKRGSKQIQEKSQTSQTEQAIANMGKRISEILASKKKTVGLSSEKKARYKNNIAQTMLKLEKKNSPQQQDYVLKSDNKWGLKILFFSNWFFREIYQCKQVFCNLQFTLVENPEIDLPYHDSFQSLAVHILRLKTGLLDILYRITAYDSFNSSFLKIWANYISDMLWFNNTAIASTQSVITCPQDIGPMALLLLYHGLVSLDSKNTDCTNWLNIDHLCGGETGLMLCNALSIKANYIKLHFTTCQNRPTIIEFVEIEQLPLVNNDLEKFVFLISLFRGDICFYNPSLCVIDGSQWLNGILGNDTNRTASSLVLKMLGF